VFFDTTVFVTATIAEVVRTLVIAIVLVAHRRFLFLGKLRTTLIPLVAVPVSIVGTFAVLLVIGYSANTVSLLALVLAIGIVVDDAIVVVENIERVIDEEPALSVPEACKKAMAEITGPILAITFVLLSVFVPVAFIPGISGQLFRQFAVAVSVSMLISALNALTLSPALCAVLLKRGQKSRGPMRYVLGAIDKVTRRLCGGGAPALRVPIFGVVVVAGVVAGSACCSASRRKASCRTRTRARSSPPCGCPKAPRSIAPRRWSSRSKTSSADPGRRRHLVGGRAELHRLRRLVEPGFLRHPAQALRGAHRSAQSASAIIARCGRSLRRSRAPSPFRSTCRRSFGLGSTGGFQYVLEALQGQPPTDVAAVLRGLSFGQSASPSSPACSARTPPTRRRSISISIATRRRCSASRSAIFSPPCNRRWALLRQRLQRFRPHLAGQYPGRHAVSRAPTTS
jgi:HAE1 family hydrophobic/amphiphilic exporter-1